LQQEFGLDALCEALGPELASLHEYWQPSLAQPLCSFAQRSGKELRPRLLAIAWSLAGGNDPLPRELFGIIEALHLGSLIVDDIEDGSRTRRGGPALHEQVGTPVALNAGNWLYFWPTLLIRRLQLGPGRELDLRCSIDRAVLSAHYGQALDLSVRVTDLRQVEVVEVVRGCSELKTGCLMELATRAGAIVAGGSAECIEALGRMGRELGIALQMLDDLTSVTSERRVHKGREDVVLARATWAWAWYAQTVDELSYGRLRQLEQRVLDSEAHPDRVVAALRTRVAEVGRSCIIDQLASTVARVETTLGQRNGCCELRDWVRELANYEG
jgi:geranylgeranyl pyrophosphate synthase